MAFKDIFYLKVIGTKVLILKLDWLYLKKKKEKKEDKFEDSLLESFLDFFYLFTKTFFLGLIQ